MESLKTFGLVFAIIFFFPFVAGMVVTGLGTFGLKAARTLALWFSITHLILTTFFVGLFTFALDNRMLKGGLQPMFVLGDTGTQGTESATSHVTSLNMLNLFPFDETIASECVQLFVGVDGLNIWLIGLSSLMTFLAVLASWHSITTKANSFYGWLFCLQGLAAAAFASFDIVCFYVFFELTLIPSFFLIGQWGVGGGRRDAARKFFLYTLAGSLFTLIGIMGVVHLYPNNSQISKNRLSDEFELSGEAVPWALQEYPSEGYTFSINKLMQNSNRWNFYHDARVKFALPMQLAQAEQEMKQAKEAAKGNLTDQNFLAKEKLYQQWKEELAGAQAARERFDNTQFWVFLALIAGFAVKIPLIPFHTWLPAAYSEAPLGITAFFTAVLSKLGAFGMLRLAIPIMPDVAVVHGPAVFSFLGATGIIYAAFCAFAQRDLKLLLAYSSISHLGLLTLGLFTMNMEGYSGALFHMVNHGVVAGALFIALAFLADRYRTLDSNSYSGLIQQYPKFSLFFVTLCLASVGLPGFNNFVSEMMILSGLCARENTDRLGWGYPIVAGLGLFFSAWYLLSMIRKIFFGPKQLPVLSATEAHKDLEPREGIMLGLPILVALFLGLFPQPLIDNSEPELDAMTTIIEQAKQRRGVTTYLSVMNNADDNNVNPPNRPVLGRVE